MIVQCTQFQKHKLLETIDWEFAMVIIFKVQSALFVRFPIDHG